MLTPVPGPDGAREAQGLVYAEAQMAGIPVVGSRLGGIPESMQENVTGILVDPGDVEALSQSLEKLWQNPQTRIGMGQKAREFATGRFSIERMLWDFEHMYAIAVEATVPVA